MAACTVGHPLVKFDFQKSCSESQHPIVPVAEDFPHLPQAPARLSQSPPGVGGGEVDEHLWADASPAMRALLLQLLTAYLALESSPGDRLEGAGSLKGSPV